jgi:ligand-binding SRPBCC domain-containing protein
MTTFTSQVRINAPKDKVWSVLADLGGIQRYNPAVSKSYYNTEETDGVGAGRVCELLPMGEVKETASQWKDGESYTLDVTPVKAMPPMKDVQAEFSVRADDDGTVVNLEMNYNMKFGPIGALMDAIMVKPQFSSVAPNILKGLKHFVETGEEVTPQVIKQINQQGSTATPTYAVL